MLFIRVTFATSRSAPIHIRGWVAWHFEVGLRRTCRKSSPMQLLSTLSSYFPYPTWLWPSKISFQFLTVRFSIDNRYRRSLLIKELPRFPSFVSYGSFLKRCKFPMASKHWKDLKHYPQARRQMYQLRSRNRGLFHFVLNLKYFLLNNLMKKSCYLGPHHGILMG